MVKSSGMLHVAQHRPSILLKNIPEHREQVPVEALVLMIPSLPYPDTAASSGAFYGSTARVKQARATLRLTLEEAGVFTSCEIRTIHQVRGNR